MVNHVRRGRIFDLDWSCKEDFHPVGRREISQDTSSDVKAVLFSVVEKQLFWTSEEKKRFYERWLEIYNQEINGSENSSQSDEEEARKRQLELNRLLSKVDEKIIAVAERRRKMPNQIAKSLARKCKFDCDYYLQVKAAPPLTDNSTSTFVVDKAVEKATVGHTFEMARCLENIKSASSIMLEQTVELQKAVVLRSKMTTAADRFLFSNLPPLNFNGRKERTQKNYVQISNGPFRCEKLKRRRLES